MINFFIFQADILFDDEKGFYSAISTIILTTKRPVIILVSDLPLALESKLTSCTVEQWHMGRPSPVR